MFPFSYRTIPDVPIVALELTNISASKQISSGSFKAPIPSSDIAIQDNPAYITHPGTADNPTYTYVNPRHSTPDPPLPAANTDPPVMAEAPQPEDPDYI